MKKPTVYLDTSIISACWYDGANIAMLSRRMFTHEWWDLERRHFGVWTSAFNEAELRAGTFPAQARCISMVRRLRYLPASVAVREFADKIVELRIVPATKHADADHLAIAATNGIDYLLTWNYAHMANTAVQARLNELCDSLGLLAPLMVSPESIPQVRFGKSIRRRR